MLGQRAICAFGKTLRLQAEGMIEARPVILPGDDGAKLYQLLLSEMFAQARKQLIRYIDGSLRHPDSVVEDEFLDGRKGVALAVDRKLAKLLLTDPVFSAYGRADIDSPWAADQGGHFYLGELFQPRIDLLRSF